MSFVKKVLKFPLEKIKVNPKKIMHSSLRNMTFYKSEEVDAQSLVVDGMTYGEWKRDVGYIYLDSIGEVPEDILFLMASKPELEREFIKRVESSHGLCSRVYETLRQNFKDIHSYKF